MKLSINLGLRAEHYYLSLAIDFAERGAALFTTYV